MARIAANLKLVRGAESLTDLRYDATSCRACHLWKHATQTVFGEGPSTAKIFLVGQQPNKDFTQANELLKEAA
jgi:DNA polymerase